jgi:hypothetical protein
MFFLIYLEKCIRRVREEVWRSRHPYAGGAVKVVSVKVSDTSVVMSAKYCVFGPLDLHYLDL